MAFERPYVGLILYADLNCNIPASALRAWHSNFSDCVVFGARSSPDDACYHEMPFKAELYLSSNSALFHSCLCAHIFAICYSASADEASTKIT